MHEKTARRQPDGREKIRYEHYNTKRVERMNLKNEIADLEREIRNLESLAREADQDWREKDVIARDAEKDAEAAWQRKKELQEDMETRKLYLLKLTREVGKHEVGA